ncbi:glycoprotein 3-alpha-L-fucosyltransferase A-like isoform X2 [Magnolia sinica]|uniref:glycoprotein 3-alpha-L-fucosyltransferase A-like isoform X2 n=1 Tax=Magnolia sinica TaxID=86752 RepID=UPI002658B7EF|nr:glycoprotein 3-alpha-L-fucosyltransferase A-like isoform X2 [Magnolia sinica]
MGGVTGHSGKSAMQGGIGGVSKNRWSILIPLFVALVVVAEIALLGYLSTAENAAMLDSWTRAFYDPSTVSSSSSSSTSAAEEEESDASGPDDERAKPSNCEDWLEREDAVPYSRDFRKDPIFVSAAPQEWPSCSVGCRFGYKPASGKKLDAVFGVSRDPQAVRVLRSMESSHYYAQNNLAEARGKGYNVIMTTSLSSDVPVGYFSWVEYDIMAPMLPKTESALAAAFISNCDTHNFRLKALDMLMKMDIKIDSYGACRQNRAGNGTIPVVIGAPNIQDFAPSPKSVLHIRELNDVAPIAEMMKDLAANPDAYNRSVRWKYEGPSDSFKALVDMAAVHSSCRLCIHLATKIREQEEQSIRFRKRPCNCTKGTETIYHLFMRERGRFEMESIFLRSGDLTLKAMESAVLAKFKSLNHVPIWKQERPQSIRGDELKVYRVYPIGITQRQALYTFKFEGDASFSRYLESNPCAKFEVIFV